MLSANTEFSGRPQAMQLTGNYCIKWQPEQDAKLGGGEGGGAGIGLIGPSFKGLASNKTYL